MKHSILLSSLLSLLLLIGCKTTYFVSETSVEYDRVAESKLAPDEDIEALIAPYRKKMDAEMNNVIGTLDTILFKSSPEGTLGNWLSDMLLEEAKINSGEELDFAVQNSGGIRVPSMAAGPITIGEVFEVMPFDNKISIITAPGSKVREFLNHMANGRGWPISKGVTYKIKDKQAIDIIINGSELDDSRTYKFALPDYIAGGGSGSDFLKPLQRVDLEVLIRNAFVSHIQRDTKAGITQHARKEGRVINLDHE